MIQTSFILFLLTVVIALTIHEAAHAYVAFKLGDPTAQRQGRISLNPIKHIDPWGALLFLLIGIGWGKPVPVNPHYFSNPKRDQALVALAGPASNFLLAAILAIFIKFGYLHPTSVEYSFINLLLDVNILLCAFNLIPIPPLDGSKILALLIPKHIYYKYEYFLHVNLSYIIVFLMVDIYFFPRLFSFSIVHSLIEILTTVLKTLIFLGT